MMVYNCNKEFVGIDAKDLRNFGLQDLADLQAEVDDFADLFVKTPGHIHNFKDLHWIDFVLLAHKNETSKVIVNVKNRSYTAHLQIEELYLATHPTSRAYAIMFNHLQELSSAKSDGIAADIAAKEVSADTLSQPLFTEGYLYDPTIAADALGLSLDLVEGFIRDFVQQANEFHEALYTSLKIGDFKHLKSLTHKLKGVAENLRIEDALELLILANTSNNPATITKSLDMFYATIAKLSQKEITLQER